MRTKLIGIPTLAVTLAVAAIGFTMLDQGREDDDNYVLSSKWDPGAMALHNDVKITVTVDGIPLVQRSRRLSPWGETLTAAKGSTVVLRAVSAHPATQFLDCIIMRNGRSVPSTGFDSIHGPGSVECQA